MEKNQFHSTRQIISSQTVNQEMRTTCLMPHFPILALNLTIRPVRISHLLMKPNRHVSYSRATEDEYLFSRESGSLLTNKTNKHEKTAAELQENN